MPAEWLQNRDMCLSAGRYRLLLTHLLKYYLIHRHLNKFQVCSDVTLKDRTTLLSAVKPGLGNDELMSFQMIGVVPSEICGNFVRLNVQRIIDCYVTRNNFCNIHFCRDGRVNDPRVYTIINTLET